jgi:hypothetical protein
MRSSITLRGRFLISAVAAGAAATMALGLVSAPAASAGSPQEDVQFGLHVPQIANGAVPTVSYGSIRLWDSGVAWGQVEQSKGKYWWVGMDKAVGAANAQGAQILYVLGSTPKWAASNVKQGTYPNKGAASNPKNIADWKNWVTAVVTRYGASIDSYQIWNEANLTTFWMGTPKQMATLTSEAYKIIRRLDPTAKVVAASSTVRLTSAFKKFFPAYLTELKKKNWPVDVFAIHTYGPSTATPALRSDYVAMTRKALAKAKAPARPLWDTEVNYGIKGPGTGYPDKDITGDTAASYVAQTYLDSIRLGVARTYWYFWAQPNDLLGIAMYDGTVGAAAYQNTVNSIAGAWVDCSTGAVNSCSIDKAGVTSQVAWASTGSGTYLVPDYATKMCDALNNCQAVTPNTQATIGSMPQWFVAG